MNINVIILDYGSGNLASVYSMVKKITNNVKISNEKLDIRQASHFILPGVGSFGSAINKVMKTLPFELLQERVLIDKVPFLGICVGMQLLFSTSNEFELSRGFNWIEGEVIKIENKNLPVPHVGWNNILNKNNNDFIEEGADMYFVHSFKAVPKDNEYVISTVDYGEEICAFVKKNNIYGTQFHPEKSQSGGMKLLKNFLGL